MPIINQPLLFPGIGSATGLGDPIRRFSSRRRKKRLIAWVFQAGQVRDAGSRGLLVGLPWACFAGSFAARNVLGIAGEDYKKY